MQARRARPPTGRHRLAVPGGLFYHRDSRPRGRHLGHSADLTSLLNAWQGGDPTALERVAPQLYDELRRLAARAMRGERPANTLQATALVNEAWIRLCGKTERDWTDRSHLLAAVAATMRHILIDRARYRARIRHGGGLRRAELDTWNWENLQPQDAEVDDRSLLIVDTALEELTAADPQTALLVKLTFFAGLALSEAAAATGLSKRTAERRLSFAKAWLGREIVRQRSSE